MSEKDLTFEDVLSRINSNFSKVKSGGKGKSPLLDNNQLQLQLATELEQVNRRWNVDPEFKITSHRGNIGKFIIMGKKLIRKILRWYIHPLFEKQKEYNASVTRTLNILKEQSNHNKNVLDEFSKDRTLLLEKIDQLTAENYILTKSIKELTTLTNKHEELTVLAFNHIQALKEELSLQYNAQQEIKGIIDERDRITNERFDNTNELMSFIRRKLRRNENSINHVSTKGEETSEVSISETQESKFQMDYLMFENRFRGSRNTIKERQKQYLPYILPTDKVLDIGCGRGEFIELLLENGISAEGIDLNEDMVEYCQGRGFNVKYIDAIAYLSTMPPQTYDCISMCQVIEHLTFDQYAHLLSLILNVLKPGGRVIIETINAQSVYAMSNWFYIDPTHTKPVHPETLDFVIKETGFHKTERKNVSPVEHINIPQINLENSEEINNSLRDLYGMLYGYQDYAIIAWR